MAMVPMTPLAIPLGVADTNIVTAGAAEILRVDGILIANTDNVERTFRLHSWISTGGPAAQTNAMYFDVLIPHNASWVYPGPMMTIPNLWRLSGLASAANVVIVHVFGWSES